MRGKNWDIFCNVVDNFGDIGVCWRLARQLAAEHGIAVRLWVDDLDSLTRLCPAIDASVEEQLQRGVTVRRWRTPFPNVVPADVVIEAFACELPDGYLASMAAKTPKPVWVNLEYLSAEDWVVRCHGLASPHPRLALTKYFFFPGFVAASGGLLRESPLMQQRDACRAAPAAGWLGLGLPPPQPGELSISMFCYENPALPQLLHAWAEGNPRLRCLIPEGKALLQTAAILGGSPLQAGNKVQLGNLAVYALPFLSQENYDRLLWLCDLNFVRGEDSFVRAQWAAQPFAWHIYPQGDAAHIAKLAAFLELYCRDLPAAAALVLRKFWMSWNVGDGAEVAAAWRPFWQIQPELREHAAAWSKHLGGSVDLARQLVLFSENLL